MAGFRVAQSPEGEDDSLAQFQPYPVMKYLGFVLGAVGRRKLLAGTCFVLVLAATIGLLSILPKSYRAQTKILAQPQHAWPMLARSVLGEEPPTYAASEIIRRRDNLLSLIEKTQLLERWLPPPANLLFAALEKSRLTSRFPFLASRPLSKEEKLNRLLATLDRQLWVQVGEGTLSIAIEWSDPKTAFQLVDTALQSFLEARRLSEISTVEEALGVLQLRAENVRGEIEASESNKASARPAQSKTQPRASRFDPEASQLKAMLEARKRVIRDTEDFRQRRLQELQAQLAEKLAAYGESYPSVVQLKKEIDSFSKEPERLVALRAEARELEASYSRRPGSSESTRLLEEGEDPQLRYSRIKYQALLDRIESARIDLDTSRSTFKYRYSIVWPPKMPENPNKPNVSRVLTYGIILAFVLAVVSATLADLRANRFIEAWQVEHALDLPIVGEVRKF